MKRDERSIINAELSHAIATMGHTDVLLVTDAGYPIPEGAWRIDLALTRGVPNLYEVLDLIHQELIPETIMYAEDVPQNNPDMHEKLQALYAGSGADIETIPHAAVLSYGAQAKAIVRTGSYVPWGNVVISCGTDPRAWFDGEREIMPPEYERRYEEVYGEPP